LFQNGTNDNLYYRWRVYSLLQGDTLEAWRTTPFMMFVGGPLWVPPPVPDPFQFDWAAFAKKFRTKPLLPRDLSEWRSQLEQLSLSRVSIRDAMIFAVERADSAAELVRVLSESMLVVTNDLSPVLAIARLWLISDILHNSNAGIQHGSQFRAG
jgi:U2-associated protein SR140